MGAFDVSGNNLEGRVPPSLLSGHFALQEFDVTGNFLTGSIVSTDLSLMSLWEFRMAANCDLDLDTTDDPGGCHAVVCDLSPQRPLARCTPDPPRTPSAVRVAARAGGALVSWGPPLPHHGLSAPLAECVPRRALLRV